MTLSESILWSLARSVVVASVAICPLMILIRQIESCRGLQSRRVWILLSVFPFFVPDLLIGFNYRLTSTQLSNAFKPESIRSQSDSVDPGGAMTGSITGRAQKVIGPRYGPLIAAATTELLYSFLQIARCLAVGAALTLLLPGTAVTRESIHAWNLLKSSDNVSRWQLGALKLQFAGPWQPMLVSWSFMALITFQEFETAALMQIDRHPIAWSVWLFDAHADRQPLSDSLRMIAAPLLCELMLLCPALLALMSYRPSDVANPENHETSRWHKNGKARQRWVAAACVLPGLCFFLIWPAMVNAGPAYSGLTSLLTNGSMLRQSAKQILTSVGFAAAATVLSMNIAAIILSRQRIGTSNQQRWKLIALLPGLMGSLVLSLMLLAMFQLPLLNILYDTWLPLLLGQALTALPKALAVVLLLHRITDRSAIHSAEILARAPDLHTRRTASSIIWRMTNGRWLLGGLTVAHWCFWDVTVASILRPIRVEPVVNRLYNEMHYGKTEALMSLSLLATIAPLFVWSLVACISYLRSYTMPRK